MLAVTHEFNQVGEVPSRQAKVMACQVLTPKWRCEIRLADLCNKGELCFKKHELFDDSL